MKKSILLLTLALLIGSVVEAAPPRKGEGWSPQEIDPILYRDSYVIRWNQEQERRRSEASSAATKPAPTVELEPVVVVAAPVEETESTSVPRATSSTSSYRPPASAFTEIQGLFNIKKEIVDDKVRLIQLEKEIQSHNERADKANTAKNPREARQQRNAAIRTEQQAQSLRNKIASLNKEYQSYHRALKRKASLAPKIAKDAQGLSKRNRHRVMGDSIAVTPRSQIVAGALPTELTALEQNFTKDASTIIAPIESHGEALSMLYDLDLEKIGNNQKALQKLKTSVVVRENPQLLGKINEMETTVIQANAYDKRQSYLDKRRAFAKLDQKGILALDDKDLNEFMRLAGVVDRRNVKLYREKLSSRGMISDKVGSSRRERRAIARVLDKKMDATLAQLSASPDNQPKYIQDRNASFETQFVSISEATREGIDQHRQAAANQHGNIQTEIEAQRQIMRSSDSSEQQILSAQDSVRKLEARAEPLLVAMQATSHEPSIDLGDKGWAGDEAPDRDAQVEVAKEDRDLRMAESQDPNFSDAQRARMRSVAQTEPPLLEASLFCPAPEIVAKLPEEGGITGFFTGVGSFFSEFGEPLKASLFATLSAAAQYQYTRKGSRSSNTQVYRGLAMALGMDMGFKNQLPRGMTSVDPLTPFKRQPVNFQQTLAQQDDILQRVLTIGGNPSNPNGFPQSTHDRLQSILQGAAPSAAFPQGAAQSFGGIVDPNFRSFAGQSFNGFPPQQILQGNGAILNPNFAPNNQFANGSGIARLNNTTAGPSFGRQSLGNLLAATNVQRQGIQNYGDQLDRINPPDGSLKSLIDNASRLQAGSATLRSNGQGIDNALSQASASFVNQQVVQQYGYLNTELLKLSSLNAEIFERAKEFRRADLKIQNDDDGLMMGSPRDFSKHMEGRNAALIALIRLKNKRAAILEQVALIRYNPQLYQRLLATAPGDEKKNPTVDDESIREEAPIENQQPTPDPDIFSFLLRTAHAEGFKPEPTLVFNWREILLNEKTRIKKELSQNKRKLKKIIPQLSEVVQQDPEGVHEINLMVVEAEELNMKALALQSKLNLDKLTKAKAALKAKSNIDQTTRDEINQRIQQFEFLLTELGKEAKSCANELARVERLTKEKVERWDVFHGLKSLGQRIVDQNSNL